MSLLDGGSEVVTVYPEVTAIDPDGNTVIRAAAVGTEWRASVQPLSADEQQVLGLSTRTRYRLRLARGCPVPLGPHAEVQWRGQRWTVDGEPKRHVTSAGTAHVIAVIQRS